MCIVSDLLQVFLPDTDREDDGLVRELEQQVWTFRAIRIVRFWQVLEHVVALHGALIFDLERSFKGALLHLGVDAIKIVHISCYRLFEMVWQLNRLHLDAELLQLLNRSLDFEDCRLLLHSRQEEVALDIEKLNLEIEPLLINREITLVLLH